MKLSAHDHFSWTVLSSGTSSGDRTLGILCVDDEIKFADLEELVPDKFEKHLILNSNRLRTFEDAHL